MKMDTAFSWADDEVDEEEVQGEYHIIGIADERRRHRLTPLAMQLKA
jgi:hypothetical protein